MAALSNGPAGEPQHASAQAAPAHADNEANAAGEWRRLHWATPILRGGIVLIALIAYVISNGVNGFIQTIQNDRLSEIESSHTPTPTPSPTATPSPSDNGFWDSIPWDQLYGIISTAVWILVIIGAVVFGWAQWRSHRFRIGEDAIEVRKGIISRSERQIRFDRIQGINISKTVLGAIFGLAKLEFDAAGEDANIELAFLKVKDAEALRTEVLTRASGAKQAKAAERATTGVRSADEPLVADEAHAHMASDAAAPGVIPTPAAQSNLERFLRERIGEIAGGEASHEDPATRSVVEVSLARIILSRLMNFAVGLVATLIAIGIITAGVVVTVVATGEDLHNVLLEVSIAIGFSSLSAVLPLFGMAFGQIQQLARFTIVGTPDGLRIGRGLFATTSDTLPPGRIHAIRVHQPVLWRPFGWWQMSIIRASRTNSDGSGRSSSALTNNVILPVGTRDDVRRIMAIALPLHATPGFAKALDAGMTGHNRNTNDGFIPADHTTKWLHPFLARRVASQLEAGVLIMRKGAWQRSVTFVPTERIQSVTVSRSLLDRMRGTVNLKADVVPGAFATAVRFVVSERADQMQDRLIDIALEAAERDNSHRWADAAARSTIASARIQAERALAAGTPVDARTSAVLQAAEEWDREHRHDEDDSLLITAPEASEWPAVHEERAGE